jgi:hypothetical protein
MNVIIFDNTRYHEHLDMIAWCEQNIGHGGWAFSIPKSWESLGSKLWAVSTGFGNTTFAFKEEKYLTIFLLRWA